MDRLELDLLDQDDGHIKAIVQAIKTLQTETLKNKKDVNDRLIRLEYILIGTDGENGMRSDVRKLKESMEGVKAWQIKAMAVFTVVIVLANEFIFPVVKTLFQGGIP